MIGDFKEAQFDWGVMNAGSGEEITQIYRSLCIEGFSSIAIKKMSDFMPLEKAQIEGILSGQLTLSGEISDHEASFVVVEEAPEVRDAYLEEINEVFGEFKSLYRDEDGRVWEPYGYVSSYGPEDLYCNRRQAEIVNEIFEENDQEYSLNRHKNKLIEEMMGAYAHINELESRNTIEHRAAHYRMREDDCVFIVDRPLDISAKAGSPVATLFKPFQDDVPFFFDGFHTTPGDAFHAALNKGYYFIDAEHGHRISYSEIHENEGVYKNRNPLDFVNKSIKSEKLLNKLYSLEYAFIEQQHKRVITGLKHEILTRSKVDTYGFIDLIDHKGEVMASVPRLPFVHWACHRDLITKGQIEDYRPVSPVGMKMMGDSPIHSDWMIGGGLNLESDYNNDYITGAAFSAAHHIQQDLLNVEHMVLSSGEKVTGKVVYATPRNAGDIEPGDIVVIPDSSPEYHLHVMQATKDGTGGVIAHKGNKVAHITTVSRENRATMLMVENPWLHVKEGDIITLNPESGAIEKKKVPSPKVGM